MTGVMPSSSMSRRQLGSTFVTSPTRPRSTSTGSPSSSTLTGGLRAQTVQKYPGIPAACTPDSSRHPTISWLILRRTVSATSSDSSSVTLTPWTFLGVSPLRSISSDISGPPPWTSRILSPPRMSSDISAERRIMSSRPRIAFPPNFRTYRSFMGNQLAYSALMRT